MIRLVLLLLRGKRREAGITTISINMKKKKIRTTTQKTSSTTISSGKTYHNVIADDPSSRTKEAKTIKNSTNKWRF